MKINVHVLLASAMLTISVLSCKKQDAQPDRSEQITEATARNYFENQVKKLPKTETFNSLPIGEPNWDSAYEKHLNFGDGIAVPLKMQSYQTRADGEKVKGDNYLLIYKKQDGSLTHEVVTVMPATSHESVEKFTGTVIIRDYSGRIVNGFRYEEGKYRAVPITIGEPRGAVTEIAMPCQEPPVTVCFDIGGGYYCIVDVPVSSCPTTGGEGGGGGTGGGGYPGGGGSPGGVNPGVYPNPGMGGGSTNPGGATPGYTLHNIQNQLKNPCLNKVFQNLLNKNLKNKVTTALNQIFNSNEDVNLIFVEKPASQMPQGFLGYLNLRESVRNSAYTELKIELNIDLLPGKPEELIATVIVHEAIHAYIAFIDSHSALTWQHEIMAQAMRTHTIDALTELFPNMPYGDKVALSWSGLIETYGWSLFKLRDDPNKGGPAKEADKVITDYERGVRGTPTPCI